MFAPVRARLAAILLVAFLFLPSLTLAANECRCVQWLRTERGINIRGDAWTITPTHPLKNASEGDVLLTTEGPGHAAEIIAFEGLVFEGAFSRPEYIWVIESNYIRCKVGTRRIKWDSGEIRGIFKPLSTGNN